MSLTAQSPLTVLRGIGPKRAERLAEAGFRTVRGLLSHLPHRYEDRSRVIAPSELRAGPPSATVVGNLVGLRRVWTRRGGRALVRGRLQDGCGSVAVLWFNRPYLASQVDEGVEYLLHGPVREGRNGPELVNPSVEPADRALLGGAVVPIYASLAGAGPATLRGWIRQALGVVSEATVPDPIPGALLRRHRLPALSMALHAVHEPAEGSDLDALNGGRSAAHQRLAYGELLALQTELALRRREVGTAAKPQRYRRPQEVLRGWQELLPFRLTHAQRRALAEIAADLGAAAPMQRLLQGDVGCGKTVVAGLAMALAAESGLQAALMAPTELLAEQHHRSLSELLAPRHRIGLLTASSPSSLADRGALASGELSMVVGTHALIQQRVELPRLGLVVVDEQHRFGVAQRRLLQGKGKLPDLLVMTATPIPRSLALTAYGDLSLSVIDELPPGRRPVETLLAPATRREEAYAGVEDRLSSGGQAYVVLPLIEESERVSAESIARRGEELCERFASFAPAVLHGRSSLEERARVMREFADGSCRVLIATTIIEVGVDVAAAHTMVIESAERFGLAQLHQLRGRVGRGSAAGRCIAIHGALGEETRRRLEIFAGTRDGFEIAEADLALRGPGDLLGVRQAGLPTLRVADLARDRDLLEAARSDAAELLAHEARPDAAGYLAWVKRRASRRRLGEGG